MPPSTRSASGDRATCASCGRAAGSGRTCPHCGATLTDPVAELAELDKALSDMSASGVDLDQQRKDLAGRMQAAKHRRDVLARTLAGQASGTRRPAPQVRRRRPNATPGTPGSPGTPGRTAGSGRPPPARTPARPLRARPVVADLPRGEKPETSSRSVQAIMLVLGALLLGVAAVVFVGVAITTFEVWGQLAILAGAAVLTLGVAPPIAARGLNSTAEAISAVGLVLISVTGYALWATGTVGALPGPTFAGLVAAVTAATGYSYHRLTRLTVPRYGALIALQFVLPALAYELIAGPVGWALVFTAVAAHNGAIGHLDRHRPARATWLRYLAWVLHGLAIGAAAGYASVGLTAADTVQAATGAGSALVLAGAVGVAGTLSLRWHQLPDVAAGLTTLAVMLSAARVAVVASPERALLPVAAVVAATGLVGRLLPERARRGPQLASAAALTLLGLFVAVPAVRAGLALPVLPAWPDDLTAARQALAAAAGTGGWQLAAAAATLTLAAVLSLPEGVRREGPVAGAALTALAAPASLGLSLPTAAWLLVVAAAGFGMTGLTARTGRVAAVHLAAAGTTGLAAAGASLATPVLTAAILVAITITGAVVASGPTRSRAATIVTRWAAGGAVLALPGAAAATTAAAGGGTAAVLTIAGAGVCGSLGYAAGTLLVRRAVPMPVTMGAGLGAVVLAIATVAAGDAAPADFTVAGILVGAAVLVYLAPRVDASRRRDKLLDGADFAAAAVTAGVVATLARLTWLVLPDTGPDGAMVVAGALVTMVALVVRAVPRQWRRGPLLGVGACGALTAGIAAAAALTSGGRVLGTMWEADLARWPPPVDLAGLTWGPSLALALLAGTAAVVLPRPGPQLRRPGAAEVSATLAVLATIGAPPALGMPWWAPATLAVLVGTCYAVSSVAPVRVRPGLPPGRAVGRAPGPGGARARALAGGVLAVYAVGASLARPWTTAAVLGLVVVVGTAVATLTVRLPPERAEPRLPIGGTATTMALLAAPGALAALVAHLGHPANIAFLAALAGSSLGLATLAVLRGPAWQLLPYGTVGTAAGATTVALVSVPTPHPTGVYAAAAVLLAVLAELVRAGSGGAAVAATGPALGPPVPGSRVAGSRVAGWVSPPMGALVAAAIPAAFAVVGMAPALRAALLDPYQALAAPWDGPPADLLRTGHVPATSALAALLLTLATALAAAGFGGAVTRQTAPVVAPGLAVTLLISPAALGAPWPAGTVAALVVFTFSVLGVALTPPPPAGIRTRVLRITRTLVLGIGLAGGGAGLAGSLADPYLTWGTFGGAVAVGLTAALGGRTRTARVLGWLGAGAAAQLFALTSALLVGVPRQRAGLFLLAVAAVALLLAARLPRLRSTRARPELASVEWLAGYASLLVGVGLAAGSVPDLAATLIGAGGVLGVTALRPDRPDRWRRGLLWAAAGCEVSAVWLVMSLVGASLLEVYTVPLAAFALAVGMLEIPRHPELTSWVVYGPGIIAALAPSLFVVVITTSPQPARQGWVLLGGVAALIFGSRRRQRAPVILGSAVTAVGALHLLSLAGPWLVLIPLGLVLFILGANSERRQRDLENIRGALDRMR
jgi:hypothetical protein